MSRQGSWPWPGCWRKGRMLCQFLARSGGRTWSRMPGLAPSPSPRMTCSGSRRLHPKGRGRELAMPLPTRVHTGPVGRDPHPMSDQPPFLLQVFLKLEKEYFREDIESKEIVEEGLQNG